MHAATIPFEIALAPVGAVLVAITILLTLAIVAQAIPRRSAALRHAILFWALISAGICPLLAIVAQRWEIVPVRLPVLTLMPTEVAPGIQPENATLQIPRQVPARNVPADQLLAAESSFNARAILSWLQPIVFVLWLAGTIVGLSRIAHGWWLVRRLLRSAILTTGDQAAARCRRCRRDPETPRSTNTFVAQSLCTLGNWPCPAMRRDSLTPFQAIAGRSTCRN